MSFEYLKFGYICTQSVNGNYFALLWRQGGSFDCCKLFDIRCNTTVLTKIKYFGVTIKNNIILQHNKTLMKQLINNAIGVYVYFHYKPKTFP